MPRKIHPVLNQMTTGTFNDTSSDGHAVSQCLVVLQIRRVIKEVIGTVVNRLSLRSGHGSQRGTAADARRHPARLAAQDLQQVRSHPTILFDLVFRNECLCCFPNILRYMDEIHDDGQSYVPLLGKPLEKINLRAIAVDQCDPLFLSFGSRCIASSNIAVITASGELARLAHTRFCSGCGRVGFSRRSSDSGRISSGVRTKRSTV